jgi:PHP domain
MKGTDLLDNAAIAELLAREGEQASGHVRQAFHRAARKAFLWEQETYDLLAAGKPLTELEGIGPFLANRIREWVEKTPPRISPPEIREEFLTLTRARRVLAEHPEVVRALNGDLHTHTCWSDGTGTLAEMATAAKDRGYQYLAITDHTKALKIARGLSEERPFDQGKEIHAINAVLAEKRITALRFKRRHPNFVGHGCSSSLATGLHGVCSRRRRARGI